MNIRELNIKVDIQKMKLAEQEEFELLSGCGLFDLGKKGLTGRRLAALIYIFAKREDKKLGLEAVKIQHEATREEGGAVEAPDPVGVATAAHAMETTNREQDREDERFEHEKKLGVASHNLAVWEAKHPPKPASKPAAKKKKK